MGGGEITIFDAVGMTFPVDPDAPTLTFASSSVNPAQRVFLDRTVVRNGPTTVYPVSGLPPHRQYLLLRRALGGLS